MLENRMVTDDYYIPLYEDYDAYLEYLLEKDDEYREDYLDD